MHKVIPATLAMVSAMLFASGPGWSQEQSKPAEFDAAQELAIRAVVKEYLLEHPEVLVEALNAYQTRQREEAEKRQREAIVQHRAPLRTDPDSPVLGNPDGDVVVVEFFDYRCGYCRRVADSLRQAVKADGKIRLVMKEFPILGPASLFAARAALASARQGLYEKFHFALMETSGSLDERAVVAVARQVGLDVDRLERDMQAPEIQAMLSRNFELAEALEIGGTPAFVIGDELVPGAIDMQSFNRKVAEIRAESS